MSVLCPVPPMRGRPVWLWCRTMWNRIIPRGAGADLADEVSALVEVTGLLEQVDEVNYIQVRGYTLVDDTSSWDDE